MNEKECCPKFDPQPWDEKTHVWKNKPFIRETIPQIFHMPLPWMFGGAVTKMWNLAQKSGAAPAMKDFILMSYDPSPWRSVLYMTVTKEVPGADNVTLSGTYISKVFDGPYNAVPKWIKEFDKYLSGKGKKAQQYYFYFSYCPKCSKKYGHNFCVAFARVD
ncbi:hypothetical protein A3K48_07555 [candidate division WOR-1 bacterium RIFOXYA12_FULL_52_29]|uniref:Uncharacterized protein n=1 Tax=candidate division WOR-1 bacterium RIFOXYC12_FULL_54_18 TaxID=1802584 RepID=A0A1F4T9P0_UNCSA|nr:MAG: hypothetical protein A3K44_07555 [candidate division WOR-1 bacterium RIFOXYA2_FULL_51_19]OGC18366.1 MAG: hypothetical protein A3K48_07555 [candidate division WOR-1 bacterium RIFOXYA12_FULL_52_29]OGC27221.1 MAG: hypothetical protein A3K32_07550 [candidate division WOR-1 bacterium RIFOXYB2_FULL_45_9]OGC28783.1 MAG: hypothetical protein A3K49_07555 [candidate division WOR-1 bacterium RIFOXYC12_FULL_54_18]OGC30763.1 MAG: hypothetical protein A2346_05060 [candidate division WOR-1 bacterium R